MLQTFLITWVTHNSRVSERMRLYEEVIIAHREEKPELGDGQLVILSAADEIEIAGYLRENIVVDGLQVLAMNICQDHVHMVIVCEEEDLIGIVRKLKSVSSRKYNVAHGFTVSDKGACSLAQEYDTKSVLSQFKGASPLVEARGKSQSQLWAQKFNRIELPDENAVYNACHYVMHNRAKHGLSENQELSEIISSAIIHPHDAHFEQARGQAPLSVSDLLATPSKKPKLLVIYGPTACGKTALTIELAKKYNGEVINADSRQIYRGMNIGTGKVTQEEMQGIVHHMLDIRDISEMYGVGEFAPVAREIIADIHARGKLPILSGGTGLFIDAVIANFTIPEVKADWEYRDELERFRLAEGDDALWEKLNEIDPDYASELDPRNYRYVIRGLEIFKATGKSKKALGQKTESPYDYFRITPYDGDREKLYGKINLRVEEMFRAGLIEEVRGLLQNYEGRMTNDEGDEIGPSSSGNGVKVERHEVEPGIQMDNYAELANTLQGNDNGPGFRVADIPAKINIGDGSSCKISQMSENFLKKSSQGGRMVDTCSALPGMTETEILEKLPGLNAIGYREVIPYLAGNQSLERTIELVQQNSRHYAKRQLTWFRRYEGFPVEKQ